jgi:AcrR family transcriptional regulator
MRRAKGTGSDRGISTEDWIRIARTTLIKEGIAGVKIDRLAKKAGVTRGGFYYRFKDHQALLDALLQDWRDTNNTPILNALYGAGTPADRYLALIRLWLDERDFKPDYDTAVRAWSHVSRKVAAVVHEIDDSRIEALRKLFVEAGYAEDEAFIRARISYFHQVGYYAMGIRESAKRRAELSDLYFRVLTGFGNGELREISEIPQRQRTGAGAGAQGKPAPVKRSARPNSPR